MGLLDTLGSDEVLGGLLSAGAASGAKGNFLARMAAGLQAGDRFGQGRREEARQRSQDEMRAEYQKLMQMKMQRDMQQQEAAAKQEGANTAAVRGSMGQFDPATFLQNNPEADISGLEQALKLKGMMTPKREIITGKPGDVFFDKGGDMSTPLGSVPERPEKPPTSVQEFLYGQQNPDFNAWDQSRKKAGAPNVNVGGSKNIFNQETEQSKAYGKGMGDLRIDIQKAGFSAPTQLTKLTRLEELLSGVDSGKLAPLGADAAGVAKSLGFNIDPKLGNKQAAEALAVEMALSMKPPGSGAMSDRDFNQFMSTIPSLSKTPEGRREITKTLRAKANRDIQIAKMARSYAGKNNGVLDDGFLDQVAEFVAANPVTSGVAPATNVDALVNKYRSK